MHDKNLKQWQHDHVFGQDQKRDGESRTLVVVILTALMMVVEIVSGIASGSMALLADGLHMASHASALAISLFAYDYARRHADSEAFSFGTGKVNSLAGFTGAILLGVFSVIMAWESTKRLAHPEQISFGQAIVVAVVGLIVNALSAVILNLGQHSHEHGHDHGHDPNHNHEPGTAPVHAHHQDHNLRSAYLHVLADALTSVLAIGALLGAKYLGAVWMDPVMGIVGAVVVLRWSVELSRVTAGVLLDRQRSGPVKDELIRIIESDGDSRVTDLHLWAIGPGMHAAILSIVAHHPKKPEEYKSAIPARLGFTHITIETHQCCH